MSSHQLTRFVERQVSWQSYSLTIDLAKNVFAVQGVDATGKPALVHPSVPRAQMLELIAALPAGLIGMQKPHHSVETAQILGEAAAAG